MFKSCYRKVNRREAEGLMGRFSAEIDVVLRTMRGTDSASLAIPGTGETLWVSKKGCIATFVVSDDAAVQQSLLRYDF